MSVTTNARYLFNNWVDDTTMSVSSSHASYPSTNLTGGVRSKVWQAGGLFEITSSNNKVYINGTTYTLTVGTYTVTTLITHFNTVTSQTLSRNSYGRFVITLGVSGTLNLSSTTNAAWSTLGYLTSSNLTGTVFTADERRYSTSEWIQVDMGVPQRPDLAVLLPPANTVFSCPEATITVQGNNIDSWASPQVSQAMTVSSAGAFAVIASTADPCRYWRFKIVDVKNSAISIAVASIGYSTITTNTNVSTGFSRTLEDQTNRLFSESGQLYSDRRPRVLSLSSVSVSFLKDDELTEMEQLAYDLGTGRPFVVCLDPGLEVSDRYEQMTHYVEVNGEVTFAHVLSDYYNMSFTMREVL